MSPSSWPSRMALLVLACIAMLPYVSADVEYCSDINTSSGSKNTSLYQSNGLCSNFCRADYAFGIVQSNGCWCSNYAPATTEDGCTTPCPGYPLEMCGGSGVYGYIALENAVSGTIGATSSSTTTTTTISETPTTTTVAAAQVTVTDVPAPLTITPDPKTVTVTPSSALPTTSTTSETTTEPTTTEPTTTSTTPTTTSHPTTAPTTSSTSTSWTPTPVTSLETVTGVVRTVTVTPTVPPTAASTSTVQKSNINSKGLSTGAAVGLTIGLVALVAILSSIGYFCWRRRQKEKNAEYNDVSARQSGSGFAPVVPSRTMSESSRYVLNTDGHRVVETWEDGSAGSKGHSRMAVVDQRLDPFSRVYQRPADSKSRDSFNTIHDDQDYSRRVMKGVLRATNPDPDHA